MDQPRTAKAPSRNAPLPLALLLLGLSTVFFFGNDRGHFYRPGHHNATTANTMGIVANLSPEHTFLGFFYRTVDDDNTPTYRLYNRFPIGGYGLIKLATWPVGDSLSARLWAARLFMLAFFVGAAVLAYLSLSRLVADQWIALTATLLTFASYYCLYYNDAVNPEVSMSLFGVLLTFHGMVIFEHEGRFRQLPIKGCVALLLGWHVYALLLPFIALRLGSELIRLPLCAGLRYLSPLSNRYLMLGGVCLLFGGAILAFNLINESQYLVLNAEKTQMENPTIESILRRVGVDDADFYATYAATAWPSFLKRQFLSIARMSLPYALSGYAQALGESAQGPLKLLAIVLGITASGALLIGLRLVRHKILLATLVLYGFCWGLSMRYHTAFHDFESVHYIGIPLVLFSLVLLFIRKRWGDRVVVGLAVAALVVFGLSSVEMSRVGNDAQAAALQKTLLSDFAAIRAQIPPDGRVFVPISSSWKADSTFAGVRRALSYYLAERIIIYNEPLGRRRFANWGIASQRGETDGLLTPGNRLRFLYDRDALRTPRNGRE